MPRASWEDLKKNGCLSRKAEAGYWGLLMWVKNYMLSFPGGTVVKNLPANAGNTSSSPGLGRSHMSRSN